MAYSESEIIAGGLAHVPILIIILIFFNSIIQNTSNQIKNSANDFKVNPTISEDPSIELSYELKSLKTSENSIEPPPQLKPLETTENSIEPPPQLKPLETTESSIELSSQLKPIETTEKSINYHQPQAEGPTSQGLKLYQSQQKALNADEALKNEVKLLEQEAENLRSVSERSESIYQRVNVKRGNFLKKIIKNLF